MASDEQIREIAKQEMFRRLAKAEAVRRQAKSHPSFEEGQRLLEKEDHAGASGAVGAGLTGFIEGMPIVGPVASGAAKRVAAGLATLVDGDSYSDNLEQAQQTVKNAQEQHPIVTTGANVAGGVTATIPAVMAAPAAFGAGGGSLLARSLMSGASGAGIGGADAAVRSGGDRESIRDGAIIGGVLGGAAPSIASATGKGVKSLIEAGRNRMAARAAGIEPEALQFVRRAVNDDALDPAMVGQKLDDLGPQGMLADLGPNLQKQAGALASTPGRGQELVRSALAERSAGANARLGTAIDTNLGPAPIPSELDAVIRQGQERVGNLYRDAFRQAQPVDTQVIADDLNLTISRLRGPAQRALQQVRGMLNVHNSDQISTNPGTLFQTRQAIDGMLAGEADPKVIGALAETRQMLDDALTQSVPRIKEIDASYAELARQREGLTRGQQVLDSGRTAPRPAELVNEVTAGSMPQGMSIGPSGTSLRMSQGARAEIDRIVGTNANDVVALNRLIKGEGDWNRSRLATLFGQDKADRLIRVLENERLFADTANTVTRNSETAARQAAQSELGGAGVGFGVEEAFKAGGISGATRAAALDQGKKIAAALLPTSGEKARESLARTLVNTNRDAVVRALMATGAPAQAPALLSPAIRAALIGGIPAGTR